MPSFKNQHFVPQCYLRQFGEKGLDQNTAKSISLFNLKSGTFISNAPIKNQCSKSYFYGKNLIIEKALHTFEGNYSTLVKKITSEKNYTFSSIDRKIILDFWFVQYIRTETSIKNTFLAMDDFFTTNNLQEHFGDQSLNQEEIIISTMKNMNLGYPILQDLECLLLINKTDLKFITSDNPAVLTNRFYFRRNLTKLFSFGLNSMGTILILPLSPEIVFIAYDKNIYSPKHKQNSLVLKNKNDIELINQFQILNCNYNIYLNDCESFKSYYLNYLSLRPKNKHKLNYAIEIINKNGEKVFQTIPNDEREKYKYINSITQISTIHACPNQWPTFFTWKINGYGYTDGSSIGYVRVNHMNTLNPLRVKKIKIN